MWGSENAALIISVKGKKQLILFNLSKDKFSVKESFSSVNL